MGSARATRPRWLNGLGDDDAPYGKHLPLRAKDGLVITNGEVRLNWLRTTK